MITAPSNDPGQTTSGGRGNRAMPTGIWILGLVSMFMDISSELVHSLLPVFMTTVLGASMMTIGMLEGIAEATASVTKVFSGAFSDYLGKRKIPVVLGYGLSALTKLIFPLATAIGWVLAARFTDRIGKGIRDAPRDALIVELVTEKSRGAAYGLRQSLDSAGAFAGPLLALIFMALFANNIKAVLWVAVIPACIAVTLLVLGVHEPDTREKSTGERNRLTLADAGRLSHRYWLVVALGSVLTLARFSDAFLVLRAQNLGLTPGFVPLIMIVMNVVYALFSYPAGRAADRLHPRLLLIPGTAMLMVSDIVLAFAETPLVALAGAELWGVHMALTQGLLSKLIADTAPDELRGTAFGIFNLISGGALLISSMIAGALWSISGASATFMAGALFAAFAAVGLLFYPSKT
ncbi:MAG: MFS transporter [Chlorobiaceae bacterium]|nr:MFS transporter [Chlorobiaceae bacterium]NTV16898.1 MFS transporter [Chlorobiaceae bacterium]